MDASETYIKMCEKAEEIQGESFRYLMPDDIVAYRTAHSVTTIWRHEAGGLTTIPYSQTFIWLPRQDQLQEILGFFGASEIYGWLRRLVEFQMIYAYQSYEQLWLAFVMKEKYNKVWNGEHWISG